MPTRDLKITPFESALILEGLQRFKGSFSDSNPPADADEEAEFTTTCSLIDRLKHLWGPGTDTKKGNKR